MATSTDIDPSQRLTLDDIISFNEEPPIDPSQRLTLDDILNFEQPKARELKVADQNYQDVGPVITGLSNLLRGGVSSFTAGAKYASELSGWEGLGDVALGAEEVVNSITPIDPEYSDSWLATYIPQGLGQVGSMIIPGLGMAGAAGKLATAAKAAELAGDAVKAAGLFKKAQAVSNAGKVGMYGVMGGAEGYDAYSRSIEQGDSYGTAVAKSLGYATIAGAIEGGVTGKIVKRLSDVSGIKGANKALLDAVKGAEPEVRKSLVRKLGKDALIGSAEEGSTKLIQDLIVTGKPDWESIFTEAGVGGIVQGLVTTPISIAENLRASNSPQTAQAVEANAKDDIVKTLTDAEEDAKVQETVQEAAGFVAGKSLTSGTAFTQGQKVSADGVILEVVNPTPDEAGDIEVKNAAGNVVKYPQSQLLIPDEQETQDQVGEVRSSEEAITTTPIQQGEPAGGTGVEGGVREPTPLPQGEPETVTEQVTGQVLPPTPQEQATATAEEGVAEIANVTAQGNAMIAEAAGLPPIEVPVIAAATDEALEPTDTTTQQVQQQVLPPVEVEIPRTPEPIQPPTPDENTIQGEVPLDQPATIKPIPTGVLPSEIQSGQVETPSQVEEATQEVGDVGQASTVGGDIAPSESDSSFDRLRKSVGANTQLAGDAFGDKIGFTNYSQGNPDAAEIVLVPDEDNEDWATFETLHVPPTARGKGVATKAIKDLFDKANKEGVSLILNVNAADASRGSEVAMDNAQLRDWYSRLGVYFPEDSLRGYKFSEKQLQSMVDNGEIYNPSIHKIPADDQIFSDDQTLRNDFQYGDTKYNDGDILAVDGAAVYVVRNGELKQILNTEFAYNYDTKKMEVKSVKGPTSGFSGLQEKINKQGGELSESNKNENVRQSSTVEDQTVGRTQTQGTSVEASQNEVTEAGGPTPPEPNIQTLNRAKQVTIIPPAGATFIRVTTPDGKVSIEEVKASSKGDNAFKDAGPYAKIEAGTMDSKKKFAPIKGEVVVQDRGRENKIATLVKSGIYTKEEANGLSDQEIEKEVESLRRIAKAPAAKKVGGIRGDTGGGMGRSSDRPAPQASKSSPTNKDDRGATGEPDLSDQEIRQAVQAIQSSSVDVDSSAQLSGENPEGISLQSIGNGGDGQNDKRVLGDSVPPESAGRIRLSEINMVLSRYARQMQSMGASFRFATGEEMAINNASNVDNRPPTDGATDVLADGRIIITLYGDRLINEDIEYVQKTIEEEVIHAAFFRSLDDARKESGSELGQNQWAFEQIAKIQGELNAAGLSDLIDQSYFIYAKERGTTVKAAVQSIHELARQIIQARKDGKITEQTARNASPTLTDLIERTVEWIKKVAGNLGFYSPTLSDYVDAAEAILGQSSVRKINAPKTAATTKQTVPKNKSAQHNRITSRFGKAKTVSEALKIISKTTGSNHLKALADALAKSPLLKITEFSALPIDGPNLGLFYTDENRVELNSVGDYTTDYNPDIVLLHEAIHAALGVGLTRRKASFTADQKKAIEELNLLFRHAKAQGIKDGLPFKRHSDGSVSNYGFSDFDEFLAEAMVNPEFQAYLARLPAKVVPGEKPRSVWEMFKRLVANFIGIPNSKYTALEGVFDRVITLVENPLPQMESRRESMREMETQLQDEWLDKQAEDQGYDSFSDMVDKDADAAEALAQQWRDDHPRILADGRRLYSNKLAPSGDIQDLGLLSESDIQKIHDTRKIPDGWYIHGRNPDGKFGAKGVVFATKDIDVSEAYSGRNGKDILFKEPSGTWDMRDSRQREKIINRMKLEFASDQDQGTAYIPYELQEYIEVSNGDWDGIDSALNPDNLVEDGQLWDNKGFTAWVWDSFEIPAVKVNRDGLIALDGMSLIHQELPSQQLDISGSEATKVKSSVRPFVETKTPTALSRALLGSSERARAILSKSEYLPVTQKADLEASTSWLSGFDNLEEAAVELDRMAISPNPDLTVRQQTVARAMIAKKYGDLSKLVEEDSESPNSKILSNFYADEHVRQLRTLQNAGTVSAQNLQAYNMVVLVMAPEIYAIREYKGAIEKGQVEAIQATAPGLDKRGLDELQTAREEGAEKATGGAAKPLFDALVTKDAKSGKIPGASLEGAQDVFEFFKGLIKDIQDGKSPTDISDRIARKLVDRLLPKKDSKIPKPALDALYKDALSKVKSEIGPLLNPVTQKATLDELVAKMMRDTEIVGLAETAFNQSKEAILSNPNIKLDASQRKELQDLQFDGDNLRGATGIIRGNLNLQELVTQSLADQNTTLQSLTDTILANADVTPAQAQKIANALQLAYETEARRVAQTRLNALLKTRVKGAKPLEKADAIIKMVNLGAFDKSEYYNALAKSLKLPTWNEAFLAKITKEAKRIDAMPQSDAKMEAKSKLLANITAEIVSQYKVWSRQGLDFYLGELGPAMWMSGILSGPVTQIVNLVWSRVAGGLNAMSDAVGYAWAAPNIPLESRVAFFRDALTGSLNILGGKKGMREGWRALTTGRTSLANYKSEGQPLLESLANSENSGLRFVSNWKWVGRVMLAIDAMNSNSFNDTKQMMAMRWALLNEGKSKWEVEQILQDAFRPPQDVIEQFQNQIAEEEAAGVFDGMNKKLAKSARLDELMELRRQEISGNNNLIAESREAGHEASFTQDPTGFVGWLFDGLIGNTLNRNTRVFKFVFPFMRTLANLINYGLDFSPFGLMRAYNFHLFPPPDKRYSPKVYEKGSPEQLALMAKAMAGIAFSAGIIALYIQGLMDEEEGKEPFFMVTGSGPRDAFTREQWRAAGNEPNSIAVKTKDGYTRWRYTDWPALSLMLGGLGTLSDIIYENKDRDITNWDKGIYAVLGVANGLFEKNLLGGASNLLTMLTNPDQRGVNAFNRTAQGWVGGFTNPAILRWARNTFDTTSEKDGTPQVSQLDFNGMQGFLAATTPYGFFYDREKLNGIGEPITQPWFAATSQRFGSFGFLGTRSEHPIFSQLYPAGLIVKGYSPNATIEIPGQKEPVRVRRLGTEAERQFNIIRGEYVQTKMTQAIMDKAIAMSKTKGADEAQLWLNRRIFEPATEYAKKQLRRRVIDKEIPIDLE